MKFAEYLHKELIFLNPPCLSKRDTIEYLTNKLSDHYGLPYRNRILEDVLEREKVKSTGLGKGLAIPHGRVEFADKLYTAFARCDNGIEWESADKESVEYIFFIVGSSKLEKEYLEILGDICRIMIRHDVKEKVKCAKTPEEVIEVIKASGVRHEPRRAGAG